VTDDGRGATNTRLADWLGSRQSALGGIPNPDSELQNNNNNNNVQFQIHWRNTLRRRTFVVVHKCTIRPWRGGDSESAAAMGGGGCGGEKTSMRTSLKKKVKLTHLGSLLLSSLLLLNILDVS